MSLTLTSSTIPSRVRRQRRTRRPNAAMQAAIAMQVQMDRQQAAARLDRRADMLLVLNMREVAERLSLQAQALRENLA